MLEIDPSSVKALFRQGKCYHDSPLLTRWDCQGVVPESVLSGRMTATWRRVERLQSSPLYMGLPAKINRKVAQMARTWKDAISTQVKMQAQKEKEKKLYAGKKLFDGRTDRRRRPAASCCDAPGEGACCSPRPPPPPQPDRSRAAPPPAEQM